MEREHTTPVHIRPLGVRLMGCLDSYAPGWGLNSRRPTEIKLWCFEGCQRWLDWQRNHHVDDSPPASDSTGLRRLWFPIGAQLGLSPNSKRLRLR